MLKKRGGKKMSKRTCKDCRNRFSDEGTCPVRFGVSDTDDATNCDTFEPITVFDRITASPEVLAVEFVGMMYDRVSGEDRYYSMFTGEFYNSYAEAIAATVAKLKEVAE
jgi:hypothetical protein